MKQNEKTPSGWYFMAWKGRSSWVGMAKREPFTVGDPINEPGDLWFEYAETEEGHSRELLTL